MVLYDIKNATDEELKALIENSANDELLFAVADSVRRSHYGDEVYLRGLIKFTNYCKNDCYYCGIRRSNRQAARCRLTKEEILNCCREGYTLGYRTFVLQGGEDPYYTDDMICEIVSKMIESEGRRKAGALQGRQRSIAENRPQRLSIFYLSLV